MARVESVWEEEEEEVEAKEEEERRQRGAIPLSFLRWLATASLGETKSREEGGKGGKGGQEAAERRTVEEQRMRKREAWDTEIRSQGNGVRDT